MNRPHMRCCGALLVTLVLMLVGSGPLRPVAAVSAPPYYLALGDSLSVGVQPDASGGGVRTTKGYVDDLYAVYHWLVPRLQLQKLGCGGGVATETTTTMITGGQCLYDPYPSQFAAAVAFLQTHHVVLVTLDIGGNNLQVCLHGGTIDPTCLAQGFTTLAQQLPVIPATLRRAAGPDVPIVGMTYNDSFLATWLQGSGGQVLAVVSEQIILRLNAVLSTAYGAFHIPVADVQGAFQTTNFAPLPGSGVPVNVALSCAWTWMCVAPPVGPNFHPNAAGYAVIAATVARVVPQAVLRT